MKQWRKHGGGSDPPGPAAGGTTDRRPPFPVRADHMLTVRTRKGGQAGGRVGRVSPSPVTPRGSGSSPHSHHQGPDRCSWQGIRACCLPARPPPPTCSAACCSLAMRLAAPLRAPWLMSTPACVGRKQGGGRGPERAGDGRCHSERCNCVCVWGGGYTYICTGGHCGGRALCCRRQGEPRTIHNLKFWSCQGMQPRHIRKRLGS